MNKKSPEKVKGCTIVLRLTEKEKTMANELRVAYNLNLSSLMRNTIRNCYKKMSGEKQ